MGTIFDDAKNVLRQTRTKNWEWIDSDTAGEFLTNFSPKYHDEGSVRRNLLSMEQNMAEMGDILKDHGLTPQQVTMEYAGIAPERYGPVNTLLGHALSRTLDYEPRTRSFSDYEFIPQELVAPGGEEAPYDVASPHVLIAADPENFNWEAVMRKLDFYAAALSAPGVMRTVTYDGKDYISPDPDKEETWELLATMLVGVPRSFMAYVGADGTVIPREHEPQKQGLDTLIGMLGRKDVDPDAVDFLIEHEKRTRAKDEEDRHPADTVKMRLFPKDAALAVLKNLGIEISEMER